MNKQRKGYKRGIEWTHVWGREGHTLNPVAGCYHGCAWQMSPLRKPFPCYAEVQAEQGLASKHYPHGFRHHYWYPERLEQPGKLKTGAAIFIDSMSDIMARAVPSEHIEAVFKMMRETPQHIYLLLTKNAPRLLQFDIPTNAWVGISSPPDFMGNIDTEPKRLNERSKMYYMKTAFRVLSRLQVPVKWISYEPLTELKLKSHHDMLADNPGVIQWAVIGAASNKREIMQPDIRTFHPLLQQLDSQSIPVFYKGNLKKHPTANANWREDFPLSEPKWAEIMANAA